MEIDWSVEPGDLKSELDRFWTLSGAKLDVLAQSYDESQGAPVYTVEGKYRSHGWTEWTQGFRYGSAILQFDATDDERFLEMGRVATLGRMTEHICDFAVHDHGFNNVSTYGNLWRLMREGRSRLVPQELALYELALMVSGAVQARRWTSLSDLLGFIYSFNGPHSLFVDTIRSLRSLALAHLLGQSLKDEGGRTVSLLERLKQHALATAEYCVYYGEGRDIYDVRGRVAHEAVFDLLDRSYRCPSSQQGYSPFSTWTRGLAWAMCGFAEELEFLRSIGDEAIAPRLVEAARATCDFYIGSASAADGIPYWDTGAPGLAHIVDWRSRAADPFNDWEPVDSSAAAIAAQGLLRLGSYLDDDRYRAAGLTVASTLFSGAYLSEGTDHEGLLLHSVYHRPNGWDHVGLGHRVPCGESTMWGDYHLRELALWIGRLVDRGPYLSFFSGGIST